MESIVGVKGAWVHFRFKVGLGSSACGACGILLPTLRVGIILSLIVSFLSLYKYVDLKSS